MCHKQNVKKKNSSSWILFSYYHVITVLRPRPTSSNTTLVEEHLTLDLCVFEGWRVGVFWGFCGLALFSLIIKL